MRCGPLHARGQRRGVPVSRLPVWVLRLLWRSPRRNAWRLHAWARAELGSRVDLLQAANACPDPTRAAAYLRHAADEDRHSRMLAARARALGDQAGVALPPVTADVDDLYDSLGEQGFLAFVADGEAAACAQFRATVAALHGADDRTAAVLRALLPDEERHAAYTRALVVDPGATRRVRWQGLGRAWLRNGRWLSRWVYLASMVALAPLLFAAGAWARAVRPQRVGWRS